MVHAKHHQTIVMPITKSKVLKHLASSVFHVKQVSFTILQPELVDHHQDVPAIATSSSIKPPILATHVLRVNWEATIWLIKMVSAHHLLQLIAMPKTKSKVTNKIATDVSRVGLARFMILTPEHASLTVAQALIFPQETTILSWLRPNRRLHILLQALLIMCTQQREKTTSWESLMHNAVLTTSLLPSRMLNLPQLKTS